MGALAVAVRLERAVTQRQILVELVVLIVKRATLIMADAEIFGIDRVLLIQAISQNFVGMEHSFTNALYAVAGMEQFVIQHQKYVDGLAMMEQNTGSAQQLSQNTAMMEF